jgi:hypothetical protein
MQDIIWKDDSHSACQKITCFLYRTREFITVLTKARHWTLFWASRRQFVPSIIISLRSILMLSSHQTPVHFSNSPTTDLICTYPAETPNIPSSKYHVLFQLHRSCQIISPGPRRFEIFRNKLNFLPWGVVNTTPTPQTAGPPLVGSLRLLI